MELVIMPSGFSPESYEVSSRDEAWDVVRGEWNRVSQFRGCLCLYDADGLLVEERDWYEDADLDDVL